MKLSKTNKVLVEAYNKGYTITKEGEVIGLKNKKLSAKIQNGYKRFCTRLSSGERYIVSHHRLQAYQKFGDKIFETGIVVRHLDGDSLNNSWDNIEIGTTSENQMDKSKVVRVNSATKASRKMQDNTRSFKDRCEIYEDLRRGMSYSEIMKKHGISSKGTISFMRNKSEEYKEYIK